MKLATFIVWIFVVVVTPCASKDFRLTRDNSGHVVSAEYWGESGNLHAAELHKHPRLEYLLITYGAKLSASDIAYLAKNTQITELHMGFTGVDSEYVTIEGSLARLAALKSLEVFSLCKERMRDVDLDFLTALPKLRHVQCNVRGMERKGKQYGLTDPCARILARCKSLRTIIVDGDAPFTDQFTSTVAEGLPKLEHLSVRSNNLTDLSLEVVGRRLRNMQWLDIESEKFTDQGVAHVKQLKSLKYLWLRSTRLQGQCAESVAGLKRLRHLELTVATIDDEGFAAVAALPKLEILLLRRLPLTDDQFAMLRKHPSLKSLFLNGSKLSSEATAQVLTSMPNLEHVSIGNASRALNRRITEVLHQKLRPKR